MDRPGGDLEQDIICRGHLRGCRAGRVLVVSLISQQLVVDVIVDVQKLGGQVTILHKPKQIHNPSLHLTTSCSEIIKKFLVLWMFLPQN